MQQSAHRISHPIEFPGILLQIGSEVPIVTLRCIQPRIQLAAFRSQRE